MDRKIAKNSILYTSIGLIAFFVTSSIFAYPDFKFAQLTTEQIKYSISTALIMMSLIMALRIQYVIRKARKQGKHTGK